MFTLFWWNWISASSAHPLQLLRRCGDAADDQRWEGADRCSFSGRTGRTATVTQTRRDSDVLNISGAERLAHVKPVIGSWARCKFKHHLLWINVQITMCCRPVIKNNVQLQIPDSGDLWKCIHLFYLQFKYFITSYTTRPITPLL